MCAAACPCLHSFLSFLGAAEDAASDRLPPLAESVSGGLGKCPRLLCSPLCPPARCIARRGLQAQHLCVWRHACFCPIPCSAASIRRVMRVPRVSRLGVFRCTLGWCRLHSTFYICFLHFRSFLLPAHVHSSFSLSVRALLLVPFFYALFLRFPLLAAPFLAFALLPFFSRASHARKVT